MMYQYPIISIFYHWSSGLEKKAVLDMSSKIHKQKCYCQ